MITREIKRKRRGRGEIVVMVEDQLHITLQGCKEIIQEREMRKR